MAEREPVVGNRLMLVGAVMYLLEWVAIIPAGESGPADPGSKTNDQIVALYQAHPKAVGLLAGWVSLVLIGRVMLLVGLRRSLEGARDAALVDVAIAAMAISVAIEVASEAVIAAAGYIATHGATQDAVVQLDALGGFLWRMILAPLGLAVGLGALAMLRSRRFPSWICWVGLAGAVMITVGGVLGGAAYSDKGLRGLAGLGMAGIPLFWIWMLAGGVYLWRRTSASAGVGVPSG